jgi:hypothetical protein
MAGKTSAAAIAAALIVVAIFMVISPRTIIDRGET